MGAHAAPDADLARHEAYGHEDVAEATQDVQAQQRGKDGTNGWSMFGRAMIVLGATALAIGVLQKFQGIVAPVFLALNLLLVVYPAYRFMARRGLPKIVASLVAGLLILLLLALMVGALVWSGTAMVQALVGYQDQFTETYHQTLGLLERFGLDQGAIMGQLKTISPSNVIGAVSGVLSSASSMSSILLVLLLTLVFMVMDMGSLHKRFAITNRLHPDFVGAISSLVVGVRRYWVVTTVFGLVVAAMDYVVLLLVGVPMAMVWAVLAFVTNYIPNIGFFIGLLPPALLALMEKGPTAAIIVVVAFSLINFVMQSIIQPKVAGDAIGISPTVSLLSLLVWAIIFGPLGALLALPLTLVVKALLIDNDPSARWVNALIAADPSMEEPEPSGKESAAA